MYKRNQVFFIIIIFFTIVYANILSAQSSWVSTSMNQIISQMKVDDSGNIYAAAGVVYRSTDGGQNWATIFSGLENPFGAYSIGISPDNTLFVGTFYNGLFRSIDKGNSWLKIDSTMGNVSGFAFSNSGAIFAASTGGIFKSTNNGDNWQQVSSYLSGSIVIDNNNRLYATFLISDYNTTIYVSTNDGNTWNPADNGLINGSASIKLDISPEGYIFAGTMYNGVFRSTDGGNNWHPINYGLASNHEWIRDFAFKSPNQVFAVSYGHVYLSNDDGDNWGVVNNGLQPNWDITLICSLGNLFLVNWISESAYSSYSGGLLQRSDFTTYSLPPELISPVNNSTKISTEETLKWNLASLPSTYHLQVAYDSLFSKIVLDSTNLVDTLYKNEKLKKGNIYFWHISAINEEGESGWSNNWNFTTSYPPIAPPDLLSPINGAIDISNRPILVWSSVPSIAYFIQISPDENFSTIIYQDSITIDTSITITNLSYETQYFWRVKTIRKDSTSTWSLPWQFITAIADVESELNSVPNNYYLFQNYPNPFNPSTTIRYRIPHAGFVSLKVYNVLSKEVLTLVNEEKPAGSYEVQFDGRNLSSGIYFYKIQAGDYSSVKKMILIK